ncbi:MAG: hypothetical protein RIS73_1495 [Bacteroidota bacterium]|jgi:hypothetical protein
MGYNDIIGTIGVGMILLAYVCNTFSLIDGKSKIFFLLNIAGAGLACYASWLINYWPFVILEGTWFIVSVFGLIKKITIKLPDTFRDN